MSQYFVAIPAVDLIDEIFLDLPETLPGCHPVPTHQHHVTLCHLPIVPDNRLDDLIQALSHIATRPLSLSGEGMVLYPNHLEPNVLAASIQRTDELVTLQERVRMAVRACGLPVTQQKFRPHITLMRLGPEASPQALATLLTEFARIRVEPVLVDRMVLYQTLRSPSGNDYQAEAVYPLGSNLLTDTDIDASWPL